LARAKRPLAERQQEMRERLARRKQVNYETVLKFKEGFSEYKDLLAEKEEIKALQLKSVKCPICKAVVTSVDNRTGRVLKCSKCRRKSTLFQ
jgi:tRNA(Ile2) C34 agmatinyltransferase TiaS